MRAITVTQINTTMHQERAASRRTIFIHHIVSTLIDENSNTVIELVNGTRVRCEESEGDVHAMLRLLVRDLDIVSTHDLEAGNG